MIFISLAILFFFCLFAAYVCEQKYMYYYLTPPYNPRLENIFRAFEAMFMTVALLVVIIAVFAAFFEIKQWFETVIT
jgi:hypothetical protein